MRIFLVVVLFLLAVAAFTLIARVGYRSSVETEFRQRSLAALEEAGLPGVEVSFDHHHATLAGWVDSGEQRARAVAVVRESVPAARVPDADGESLSIRPTLPPEIEIVRREGESRVHLTGSLGTDAEANRQLLGSRLHALEGVEAVDDDIGSDPKRLPLRATAELASLATGLMEHSDRVAVSLSDERLRIEGRVPNEGLKEAMLELAGRIGADELVEHIAVPEPVSPEERSSLELTRNRFGVSLSGTVASEEVRRRLVSLAEKASKTGTRVFERIDVKDAVEPAAWEGHASATVPLALKSFSGEMSAELGARRVRLAGTVKSQAKRETLLTAFEPLRQEKPDLALLADIEVVAEKNDEGGPPVRLLAVFEEGLVTIDGNVPEDSFVGELEGRIESDSLDTLVKNEVAVTASSPGRDWVGDLDELLAECVARVESGRISIEKRRVELEGETASVADPQILENVAVNTVPAEFSVENRLTLAVEPEPTLTPEARAKFSESLRQYPVYFDSNSDEIDDDGREQLEEIVAILDGAEAPVDLAVSGFADNVGNAEYNRQLSLRRAESVVEVLAAMGIAEDAMSTESVGEDVSDLSRSERWKARRVEVSLAAPEETDASEESDEE